MRTIILTLICHYSGMNGKVVFLIPFLLDQEVILLRQSLLLHFMICHSNKCHRPRTSSCHKEQRGGTEYG